MCVLGGDTGVIRRESSYIMRGDSLSIVEGETHSVSLCKKLAQVLVPYILQVLCMPGTVVYMHIDPNFHIELQILG